MTNKNSTNTNNPETKTKTNPPYIPNLLTDTQQTRAQHHANNQVLIDLHGHLIDALIETLNLTNNQHAILAQTYRSTVDLALDTLDQEEAKYRLTQGVAESGLLL